MTKSMLDPLSACGISEIRIDVSSPSTASNVSSTHSGCVVMFKLTKRRVEGLKIRKCDYLVWDNELRGFGQKAPVRCMYAMVQFDS